MRRIDLSMEANEKYKVIKKLVDTSGNKKRGDGFEVPRI